jgi:hypothetical protein
MYNRIQPPNNLVSNQKTDLMSGVGRKEKTIATVETKRPQMAGSFWPNFQAAAKR